MVVALEYPIWLALGYLILVAYFFRTIFMSIRLPGAVGVLMAGWLWSAFAQEDIVHAREDLQELAFFLVLLICGFHISLKDLSLPLLVMSFVPVAFELVGLSVYAVTVFGMTTVQGLVMATCFCAVGDGLVIPKMKEFGAANPGHPLPRLVFAWVPLEDTFALTLFGILSGFAKAEADVEVAIWRTVLANLLRIVITVALGFFIGHVSAILIPRRAKFRILGRQVFTGATVEAFLLIFGVALTAFGLGKARHLGGVAFIPIGLAPGPIVQSELLVIVLGISFGDRVAPELLHDIETVLGGVWVFGQLFLFGMLGSKTSLHPFMVSGADIMPCMVVGFVFRAVGITVGLCLTQRQRSSATSSESECDLVAQANHRSLLFDAGFCFLAMLPRASIQGALAGEPSRRGFFSNRGSEGDMATHLIANGGRVYIVVNAIFGSILLDLLGPKLLQASMDRASLPPAVLDQEKRMLQQGWKARFRRWRQRTGKNWDDHLTDFEKVTSFIAANSIDLISLTPMPSQEPADADPVPRRAVSWSPNTDHLTELQAPLSQSEHAHTEPVSADAPCPSDPLTASRLSGGARSEGGASSRAGSRNPLTDF